MELGEHLLLSARLVYSLKGESRAESEDDLVRYLSRYVFGYVSSWTEEETRLCATDTKTNTRGAEIRGDTCGRTASKSAGRLFFIVESLWYHGSAPRIIEPPERRETVPAGESVQGAEKGSSPAKNERHRRNYHSDDRARLFPRFSEKSKGVAGASVNRKARTQRCAPACGVSGELSTPKGGTERFLGLWRCACAKRGKKKRWKGADNAPRRKIAGYSKRYRLK